MLKDADHSYFAGIYIICGYTDLRFGIDSLAAIIERRFHMHLFVPNTLFLSAEDPFSAGSASSPTVWIPNFLNFLFVCPPT